MAFAEACYKAFTFRSQPRAVATGLPLTEGRGAVGPAPLWSLRCSAAVSRLQLRNFPDGVPAGSLRAPAALSSAGSHSSDSEVRHADTPRTHMHMISAAASSPRFRRRLPARRSPETVLVYFTAASEACRRERESETETAFTRHAPLTSPLATAPPAECPRRRLTLAYRHLLVFIDLFWFSFAMTDKR
jgi:hypothetical protein